MYTYHILCEENFYKSVHNLRGRYLISISDLLLLDTESAFSKNRRNAFSDFPLNVYVSHPL